MLASLLALPFVPRFLKPIKGKSLAEIDGVQVIATCKPGTVFLPNKKGGFTRQAWSQGMKLPLKLIKHTPYRTTVESEVPCVITNIVYRDQDITYTLLADDSSMVVGRGNILRVDIWHHGYGRIYTDEKQTTCSFLSDYAVPCSDPILLALLVVDRKTADRIQGYRPGTVPWDPTQIFHDPYRNCLRYHRTQRQAPCDQESLVAEQGWAEGKCMALKNKNRKVNLSLA